MFLGLLSSYGFFIRMYKKIKIFLNFSQVLITLTNTNQAFKSTIFGWLNRHRGRSLSGGANIHIFMFTDLENNGFQKKLITQNTNI